MPFISITPTSVEVRGRLNTGHEHKRRKVVAVLPIKQLPPNVIIEAAKGARLMGVNGPWFDNIDWVQIDRLNVKLRVRVKDLQPAQYAWDGVPEHVKFEARGRIEDLVYQLGGSTADFKDVL